MKKQVIDDLLRLSEFKTIKNGKPSNNICKIVDFNGYTFLFVALMEEAFIIWEPQNVNLSYADEIVVDIFQSALKENIFIDTKKLTFETKYGNAVSVTNVDYIYDTKGVAGLSKLLNIDEIEVVAALKFWTVK